MLHTPGHTMLLCPVPSPGDHYYLSGRATVERLDHPRSAPPGDELAALRKRVAAVRLSHREIMGLLGLGTRDAVWGRLNGRYRWEAPLLRTLEGHLDKMEGK